MMSFKIFCYLLIFYSVDSMEADPMHCLRKNEILDCVFQCPPQKSCYNRNIVFDCLDVIVPCRPQCVCKTGFLRDSNGDCVTVKLCDKCTGSHEVFACGSACDTECATLNETCKIINIKCNEKCYCEEGYARNRYGTCIPISECPPKSDIS